MCLCGRHQRRSAVMGRFHVGAVQRRDRGVRLDDEPIGAGRTEKIGAVEPPDGISDSLLVGFSDDRRLFVLRLFATVFFNVFVIIIVGIPRWHHVGRVYRPSGSALGDVCGHIGSWGQYYRDHGGVAVPVPVALAR
jgi:hypothetical protein